MIGSLSHDGGAVTPGCSEVYEDVTMINSRRIDRLDRSTSSTVSERVSDTRSDAASVADEIQSSARCRVRGAGKGGETL
jgi:hypothetical protein